MNSDPGTLAEAEPGDHPAFRKELQEAFAVAVVEQFGSLPDGPIPSAEVLDNALGARDAAVLRILSDGRPVGGAVLTIDGETRRNALDLVFLKVGGEGRCPETVRWQTHTPDFEKRNIHFHVDKRGFRNIEFFNKCHPCPEPSDGPDDGYAFQFEKII